jgi:polyisoprenyl-teichoic acid--peptidoglycan teichoic acid transferase
MTPNFKSKPLEIDSKVNLLDKTANSSPKGKKIFKVSKFILYLLSVMVVAFFIFSYQVLFTGNSISKIFAGETGFFAQLTSLAGNSSPLQGEAEDRINVLLLGMGGAGHDGPYLSDTMILVSIKPSTKKVSMVSIPRDLLVEIPGFGYWKINNSNAFGEQKDPGNGGTLAKEVVSKTFDIPVHYYVRIDFAGFEKIIDEIGGIKVQIDRSFTDYQYPTEDHKYQVIAFEEGRQTMDGETALKFTRSRHGNNGEGSDFARSQRQQKVLQAFKQRLLSYDFLLNPTKIKKLSKTLSEHIRTDLELWETIKLAQLTKEADTENIITQVLDDSPNGNLYASIVNEAYVLIPKGDNFSYINRMVKNIFNKNDEQAIEEIQSSQVSVEIRNGTTTPGLASINSQDLKFKGFKISKIGNAPEQTYEQTVIYKLSNTISDKENILKEKYNTEILELNIPDWVKDNAAPDLDYFVILGSD